MPDWGARSFQGTHTCLRPTPSGLRDTLAVTPHLTPDPGNHKPTLHLCGFSCPGHFGEMDSHILWLSVSGFSYLHCIWGLTCFAGCVTPKFEFVLPALCPWDPSSTSTFPKPRIWRGTPPHPWHGAWCCTHTLGPVATHTWSSNPCPEPFVLSFPQANTHTPSWPHLTCLLLREALHAGMDL